MATKTAGTKSTTNMTALQFNGLTGALPSDADVAAIANAILNDQTGAIWPGAFARTGLLYVPRRGVLQMQPDDWVLVGPDGFPYLVPDMALPTTLTATGDTHTSTSINNLSTNVIALGWKRGAAISSSNADIPAGATIASIAADGLSLTLSAAATATNAGGTLTVGSFTHS